MPEIIQNIYDYDGKIVYPITKTSAVISDDGLPLDQYIETRIQTVVQEEVSDIVEGNIPAERLIPQGGTTGQVLVKNSNDNYDISWVNAELDTPIDKVIGTLENPVILSELPSGVYRIVGNNYIIRDDTTYFVDATGSNLYIRSVEDNNILKISTKGIIVYTFTDDGYTTDRYVTEEDVNAIKNSIMQSMPTKLSQLENDMNFVTSEEVATQITEQLNNGKIEELIDERIFESIGPIPDEDIANLFKQ